jgi:hypothetical protein
MNKLLLDTSVFVDYLRNVPVAVAYVEATVEQQFLSAIVVAELYGGVRDGLERNQLDAIVATYDVLPITETLAVDAGLLWRKYRPSHGVGLADALLAATALAHGATLVTLNAKHFPMLPSVLVPYQKP